MTQTINIEVTRIFCSRPPTRPKESTWYLLNTDQGRAVGCIGWDVQPGERLRLTGDWVARNGQPQFSFNAAVPDVPVDRKALLQYVCSRAAGVGPALTTAIWDALGEEWPSRLGVDAVEALGPKKYAAIRESLYKAQTEEQRAEAIGWLLALGATDNLATKAWNEHEIETVPRVERDPYILCELDQVGFVQVDTTVARALGIDVKDPRRMRAGMLYAFSQIVARGNTLVSWEDLRDETASCLPEATIKEIAATVKQAATADGDLVRFLPPVAALATPAAVKAATGIRDYMQGVAA